MRKLIAIAAIGALCGVTPAVAQSGPDNPTATHDNPSACVGAERATRNSNGGDREHGAFGEAQREQVHTDNETSNYGQATLLPFLQACLDELDDDEE